MLLYEGVIKRALGKPYFITPEQLAEAAEGYFNWAATHPHLEEVVAFHQGVPTTANKEKMRAFTWKGLAQHLGMSVAKIRGHAKQGEEWEAVVEAIGDCIYEQKFQGAAAGLLNSGLITRDLGLVDRQEVDSTVKATVETSDVAELDAEIAALQAQLTRANGPG